MGLPLSLQVVIADELAKDKPSGRAAGVVDFMMQYELGLDEPDPNRATKSALTIGLSYVAGGGAITVFPTRQSA
jgi:hypothetical protein